MADEGSEVEGQEEIERTDEPKRMSLYVYCFMGMCVFMTAAMAYYAWGVFSRNI